MVNKAEPEEKRRILQIRHTLLRAVRDYFYEKGYIEVETPALVATSSPDPYIDPVFASIGGKTPFFLHTSPEIGMKKLLAWGEKKIFQVCKVYRVEEFQKVHNTEFTMLEWYMEGDYRDAMKETEELLSFVAGRMGASAGTQAEKSWETYDLSGIMKEITGIDPFLYDRDGLAEVLKERGFGSVEEDYSWNDLFFKLFIEQVEPKIDKQRPTFITDWPFTISTMAKRKDGQKVERFELYYKGLEIANGYTELTDREEQKERFISDNILRKRMGKETFPIDEEFLDAIGRLPSSFAGVSVGLDRLMMALFSLSTIEGVLALRVKV